METNPAPSLNAPQSAPVMSEKHELQIYLALTVAVFIILGLIVTHIILRNRSESIATQPAVDTTVPIQSTAVDTNKAWLKVESTTQTVAVGQPLSVQITGNSEGRAVTGFDVLFAYNRNSFNVASVVSANPAFQLYKGTEKVSGNIVTIPLTFTLNSDKNEGVRFNGENLATVTLTAQTAGSTAVTILPTLDNRTTRFVDNQVKVLTPQIQSFSVIVQ